MKLKFKQVFLAALAATSLYANAADSINLGNYQVTGVFALDSLSGLSSGVSGLEASAVTYARDRGTLFYVGDEGTGVVEISTTGQTLGTMSFNWTGTGSSKHDTEGLTYLGNGVLVVGEERLYDAYKFTYAKDGTASLINSSTHVATGYANNNSGMEGISYDPRDGSFVAVKQENPQNVFAGNLTFAAGLAGTTTMAQLFDPTLMGLGTLSDVQTLSPVDALAGTAAADNLLVLSLGSRKLIEVTRQGVVKSVFDLSNVLPNNGIEGVTVDQNGTIYLVAEQIQDGVIPTDPKSQLIVLSAVPEAESYAMFLAGLGMMGAFVRRRKTRSA
jgi:uncharacterized protein YjiK